MQALVTIPRGSKFKEVVMKKIFYAVAMVACLAGCAWSAGAEQEVITPYDLRKVVSDDLGAARAQYLNKTVQVKGTVASTYISRFMTPNVVISNEGAEITCVLPYRDMGKLSNFKPGQAVTMSGRVHVMSENIVLLKESRIVE